MFRRGTADGAYGIVHWIAAAYLLTLLSGCGGGSGGEGSSGGSSSSVPSGPSVSLSTSAVNAQAHTSELAPTIAVGATVVNPPDATYYYRYQWNGVAIASVTDSWTSQTTLRLSATLYPPANAGAGTYSSTIRLEFCLDSECAQPFGDSPKMIPVTYTVTGSALPITTFNLTETNKEVESISNLAPASVESQIQVSNRPPYPIYIQSTSATGQTWWGTDFRIDTSNLASLIFSFQDPATMAAGTHVDTMQINLCLDSTCTRKTTDSPKTITLSYDVLAREGREYNRLVVPRAARDLAWDPHSQRLFAVIQDPNQISGHLLSKINPNNGSIEATVTLDGTPSKLSLSRDGQYAYVAATIPNTFEAAIARYRLDTMSLDTRIPLETSTNWLTIADFAVAPAAPDTLAILVRRPGFHGLVIYEQTIKKAEWGETTSIGTQPASSFYSVEWGGDVSRLYVVDSTTDSIFSIAYSGSVLSQSAVAHHVNNNCSATTNLLCMQTSVRFDAGILTSNFGTRFNTTTQSVVGNYALGKAIIKPSVVTDSGRSRDFFYYGDTVSPVVKAFDSDTLKRLMTARISGLDTGGNIGEHKSRIVRWGLNGLAMNTPSQIVIVSGGLVTP